MIGVRLDGRLGNQLFQYAFALSLSKTLKTSFYISQYNCYNLIYEYFVLPSNGKMRNKLIERFFWKEMKYIEGIDFNVDNWMGKCIDPSATYSGFMQSYLFFKNVETDVFREFTIRKKWTRKFNQTYGAAFKNQKIIAIHVRKGDYTHFGHLHNNARDISLPIDYFLDCFKQIEKIEAYQVYFISDDIDYCKSAFGNIANAHFNKNNEIMDFQLLMNADICIVSNSSFSWWAAFLNKKEHKEIFAPKYWMGYRDKKWSNPYIFEQLNWNVVHHEE